MRNLWRQTPSSQKIEIIGTVVDQAVIHLVQEEALDKEELRLSKILSLSITLAEAMELQLTNYLSYISHLVRSHGLNARSLLNAITEFIKNIEEQLHKDIEKQVEVYRSMQDDEEQESWNDTDKRDEQANYKFDETTRVERVEGTAISNPHKQVVEQEAIAIYAQNAK